MPVNPELKDLKRAFTTAFDAADRRTAFAFGNSFNLKSVEGREPCLFIRAQDDGSDGPLHALSLPLSEVDAQVLYHSGSPSSHGLGKETVYDPEYRDARHLLPQNFALSFEFLGATNLLGFIAREAGLTGNIIAKANKINIYAEGGFFKGHRDTPLEKGHIGSLVVCLPSTFAGGNLVVRHNGTVKTFDFAKASSDLTNISWVFLYPDCEHEVEPVRSGHRVTIQYDIFTRTPPTTTDDKLDSRLSDLQASLQPVLACPAALKIFQGGQRHRVFGLGLRHMYTDVPEQFKGADQILRQALDNLGCQWHMEAVWNKTRWDGSQVLVRHRNFYLVSGAYQGEDDDPWKDATRCKDVVWLHKPEHFGHATTYNAHYGNFADFDTAYSAAAIFITGPPSISKA